MFCLHNDCNKNCVDEAASRRTGPYPMLVTGDQGHLEVHIERLKLSSAVSKKKIFLRYY